LRRPLQARDGLWSLPRPCAYLARVNTQAARGRSESSKGLSGQSRIAENLRIRIPPTGREPPRPDFGDQSKGRERSGVSTPIRGARPKYECAIHWMGCIPPKKAGSKSPRARSSIFYWFHPASEDRGSYDGPNLYQISARPPDSNGQIFQVRHSHTSQVYLLLAAGRTHRGEADWPDARVRQFDAASRRSLSRFSPRGSIRQIMVMSIPFARKNWHFSTGRLHRAMDGGQGGSHAPMSIAVSASSAWHAGATFSECLAKVSATSEVRKSERGFAGVSLRYYDTAHGRQPTPAHARRTSAAIGRTFRT
jgi:hypothetical protein